MQGKQISGYTLQHPIGTGGMAEVWYAENKIGKKAAVKMLLPKLCQDENVVSRFLTEAKVMVELNHPNIRQVYDYGDIDGRLAIVMEYLDGDDLKARMKRGQRFTDEELKRWWDQLVDALNYTHKKGIVHRDIKPGNIFVDREGNIKLLDFGIAKVRESISSTQTGQKLGTLMYMSPEQVKDSKHIDYRTDVYSLAVTFVHLITGKKPYNSDTTSDFEISEQIVYKPLDLSGLPEMWQSFLAPYLNKDPEQRPELCHFKNISTPAYRAESDDEGTMVGNAPTKPMPKKVEPKHETRPEPSEKPKSKKGLWIGLGAVAAVAVLLVLLLKPKKEELVIVDPDTEAYQACQTIEDYRAYIRDYGRNAIHYNEAQQYVDNYMADSIQQAQQALAEAKAKEQVEKEAAEKIEAEQKAQEAEKKEDAAYKKCTSIAGCEAYLKAYPNGKYVAEVKKRKLGFEDDEYFDRCRTLDDYKNYRSKYPKGKHDAEAQNEIARLEKESEEENTGYTQHKIYKERLYCYLNPERLNSDENGIANFYVVVSVSEQYFQKIARADLVPELNYNGKRRTLESIVLVGEKAKSKGDFRVEYKNGGTFSKHYSIPFEKGMENCVLSVSSSFSIDN